MLTRDGTAEPVSREEILRHERGQRNTSTHFSYSLDHEQDVCGGRLFVIHFIPMVGVGKERRKLFCPW